MIPYGSLIVYRTPKGRRYTKRLEEGADWHSNDGCLSAAAVHEADFGSVAVTSLGVPIRLQEATLFDRLKTLKRQTQVIYPKDVAYICLKLGAGPDRRIVEAGSGSGGLTMGLSWFCGPTGRVYTHEAREEFLRLARRNLDWAGLGANVELIHRDIADGFTVTGADALFLDVRTPWEYLDQALAATRPGAMFGFLVPTVEQVSNLLLGLERRPFAETEVCEILIRTWKPLADRLRPDDRMIAHTGFLIFARQQDISREFEELEPRGTRERKQDAARRARLADGADDGADSDAEEPLSGYDG